ncbi:Uncharacterised protein [Escherichia coli]|uniref:Uncharacterized protein n=1 Tax=Escherichia coli TaxID=562 RepID=A0A376Y4D1_ECOLX|nr:Uncharacterised protein [Escherichia coli]
MSGLTRHLTCRQSALYSCRMRRERLIRPTRSCKFNILHEPRRPDKRSASGVLRLPALLIPGLNLALRLLFCRFAVARPFRLVYGAYNIFGVAMAFFHPRLLFLFSFFFSARLASTFFDGLPVCFSLGARVFGRNSSITRALIGSSI